MISAGIDVSKEKGMACIPMLYITIIPKKRGSGNESSKAGS